MKTIYLGGSIAGISYDQATIWRNRVRKLLTKDFQVFQILDPMRDKEHLSDIELLDIDHTTRPEDIFNRDMSDIDKSDIILCNLMTKSLGSLFENGYAYAKHKPVILVIDEDYIGHPFLMTPSRYVTTDIDKAVMYINTNLRGIVDRSVYINFINQVQINQRHYKLEKDNLFKTFKAGLAEEVAEYIEAKETFTYSKTSNNLNNLLLEIGDVFTYLILLINVETNKNKTFLNILTKAEVRYAELKKIIQNNYRNIDIHDHVNKASLIVNAYLKRVFRNDKLSPERTLISTYTEALAHILLACDNLNTPLEYLMQLNREKINKRFSIKPK